MPRMMSFALTIDQFRRRTKDVTRRCGWDFLQPGDLLWGVEKAMGLKKGERATKLGLIEIVSTAAEPVSAITECDVVREGFPSWTPEQFVAFFCEQNNTRPSTIVNRIEFQYIGYLATTEMLTARALPGRDADPGELVFRSTDLCGEWSYTKPFYVSVRTLRRWLRLEDLDGCREQYKKAVEYYERAYGVAGVDGEMVPVGEEL